MVHVTLKDMGGTVLVQFDAALDKTLIEQMEEHMFDMPYSCRAGACMTCAVTVLEGKDCIDEQLGGEKFIDTDDDQILTCIAGIKPEYVSDDTLHTLVLAMIDFY